MTFVPGDFVRLRGLRGPRMMVIAVVSANPDKPHAPMLNVAWFDKLDNLQERQMQAAWLETWPLPTSDPGDIVKFPPTLHWSTGVIPVEEPDDVV